MPINQPDYELARKLGFYGAGGKDPGHTNADQFNQGIDTVSKVASVYDQIVNGELARKKTELEMKKTQQGLTPLRDLVMPLTPANASRQAPPQSLLEPGQSGPQTLEGTNYQNQVAQQDKLYGQREAMGNISLDQAKELAGTNALNAKANPTSEVLPVSALPAEAKARALAAGFTEDGTIDLKKFNALRGNDPSASVPVLQATDAVKQGQVAGNAKIIGDPALGIGGYANVRQTQNILAALPSRSSQGTLPAQASGVQLAARQLKALIATPGSYQRLGLAKGDLARMVLRAAPQQEVLKDAGFSDTLINHVNVLRQKISSDPTAIDQPLIRKELYDIGTELENSSRPVLERSLNEVERSYKGSLPPDWNKTRSEELGENFPTIPFQEMEINPVSVDHNAALEWAKTHPLDPRAKDIFDRASRLGAK